MIETILPSYVATAEVFDDAENVRTFSDEQALVENAIHKRKLEFTTARHCARVALAKLDVEPTSILAHDSGVPIWPANIVGSITHCTGYRAACVALTENLHGLGLDAEPNCPLSDGLPELIALPVELIMLKDLMVQERAICWDKVLFSAKEAVYKAWFPITGQWLEFDDVCIQIDLQKRNFEAKIMKASEQSTRLSGQWMVQNELILTAVTITS